MEIFRRGIPVPENLNKMSATECEEYSARSGLELKAVDRFYSVVGRLPNDLEAALIGELPVTVRYFLDSDNPNVPTSYLREPTSINGNYIIRNRDKTEEWNLGFFEARGKTESALGLVALRLHPIHSDNVDYRDYDTLDGSIPEGVDKVPSYDSLVFDTPLCGVESMTVGGALAINSTVKRPRVGDDVVLVGAEKITDYYAMLSDRTLTRIPVCGAAVTVDVAGAVIKATTGAEVDMEGVDYDGLGVVYVMREKDTETFVKGCEALGLYARTLGKVTEGGYVMRCGERIVELPASLVQGENTKALRVDEKVTPINAVTKHYIDQNDYIRALTNELTLPNNSLARGYVEKLDTTSGGMLTAVNGGKYALTPMGYTACYLPVTLETESYTAVTHSTNPDLYSMPYTGASRNAVKVAMSLTAAGVNRVNMRFCTVASGKDRAAAWAGVSYVARKLGAVATESERQGDSAHLVYGAGTSTSTPIPNVFDECGRVYRISHERDEYGMPEMDRIRSLIEAINEHRSVIKALVVVDNGIAVATAKSCMGAGFGFTFNNPSELLFEERTGDILVMCDEIDKLRPFNPVYLGEVEAQGTFTAGRKLNNFGAIQSYTYTMEKHFPTVVKGSDRIENFRYKPLPEEREPLRIPKPRIVAPFVGDSILETDMRRVYKRLGIELHPLYLKEEDVDAFAEGIADAHILDFSCIDGTGIESLLADKRARDALRAFLDADKLVLATGGGATALVKAGFVEGVGVEPNVRGRVGGVSRIKVSSVVSPLLGGVELGRIFAMPIYTDCARFIFTSGEGLESRGTVAMQYVDLEGLATMECTYNVTGAEYSAAAVNSRDGKVLCIAGLPMRTGEGLYRNLGLDSDMKIYESGVAWFK